MKEHHRLFRVSYQVQWIWFKTKKFFFGGRGCGTFLLCCWCNALFHHWFTPRQQLNWKKDMHPSLRRHASLDTNVYYNSGLIIDSHNSDSVLMPPFEEEGENDSSDEIKEDDTLSPDSLTFDAIDSTTLQRILNAQVHLIDLRLDLPALRRDLSQEPYAGISASFCALDWSLHKSNPNRYPMLIDLIQHSPECQDEDQIIHVDLRALTNAARHYDAHPSPHAPPVKLLEMTAVIFHESRCGSTLVANLLAAMHPAEHRVYSEPKAPMQAISTICGEDFTVCAPETAAAMLQDVLYLMRRTNDMQEERIFVKFPSVAARVLPVFTQAFPTVPYLLMYRDPIEVLQSHFHPTVPDSTTLGQQTQKEPPPVVPACLVRRHSPGIGVVATVQKYQASLSRSTKELSDASYCAAHLASITDRMVSSSSSAQAILLNYRDVPERLYSYVLPHLLGGPVSQDARLRMDAMAALYSKNRDGEQLLPSLRTMEVTTEIRDAVATFLRPSYEALEAMNRERRNEK